MFGSAASGAGSQSMVDERPLQMTYSPTASVFGDLLAILGLVLLSFTVVIVLMRWRPRPRRKQPRPAALRADNGSPPPLAELQAEIDRLRAVLRLSTELNSDLNYDRVLDLTLDLAASALRVEEQKTTSLLSALFLLDGDQLVIAAGRGLTLADQRLRLQGKQGVLAEALNRADRQLTLQPEGDPELRMITGMTRCSAAVCVPLSFGFEVYGVLLVGHSDPAFFNTARLEILEAISNQAVTALQNARLYRDLELEKERIMEIQEEARKKLARNLHDGPAQSIGAITMRVNFARRLLDRRPEDAREELFKIEELARRTTKEIRQMLFTLRPLILESRGLIPALHQLAREENENHGQNVVIEAEEDAADGIEVGRQNVIFYVAEESIVNARKHAQATAITLRAWRSADLFHLEIEDDGNGFDLAGLQENYDRRGSLGMVNLHERADLVSGTLQIRTEPGMGTLIRLLIPLTSEAGGRLQRHGYAG